MTKRHTIVRLKQEARNKAKEEAQANWLSGSYQYMSFVSRAAVVCAGLEGGVDLDYLEQEALIWHYIEAYSQELCTLVEDKLHGHGTV